MKTFLISRPTITSDLKISLFSQTIQAGFPSPADDYVENVIDLNDLFEVNDASTYFVRADGMSMNMSNEGILPDDILCVRRDLDPKSGDIVIAIFNNEFTVKKFRKVGQRIVFEAANDDFPSIEPLESEEVQIWGVVTGLARLLKKGKKLL